jgi:hypothetical protein
MSADELEEMIPEVVNDLNYTVGTYGQFVAMGKNTDAGRCSISSKC